jgi:hypothetical protein
MSILSTLQSLWGRLFGGTRPQPAPPRSMLDSIPLQESPGWVAAQSSALRQFKYEPHQGRPGFGNLIVVFANYPKQYTYYDVPVWAYRGLLTAGSQGDYMHRVIFKYSIKR